MKKGSPASLLRLFSLCGFTVVMVWASRSRCLPSGSSGSFPAEGPLYPLEALSLWLSGVDLPRPLLLSSVVLFIVVAAMTLSLGRVFCGWICPVGAVAEFCAAAGRGLRLPRAVVSNAVDSGLKIIKYLVLPVVLWRTMVPGLFDWHEADPWAAGASLFLGWSGARPWGVFAFFAGVVGAGLFVERFWCRYLCPLGAALGILGWMTPLAVGNSNRGACFGCGTCIRACPVQLDPGRGAVSGAECLVCGRCVDEARFGCRVGFRFAGRGVRVLTVGIAALTIFGIGYFVAWELDRREARAPEKTAVGVSFDLWGPGRSH